MVLHTASLWVVGINSAVREQVSRVNYHVLWNWCWSYIKHTPGVLKPYSWHVSTQVPIDWNFILNLCSNNGHCLLFQNVGKISLYVPLLLCKYYGKSSKRITWYIQLFITLSNQIIGSWIHPVRNKIHHKYLLTINWTIKIRRKLLKWI